SSVVMLWLQRRCNLWRRHWIQTALQYGRWTGGASPSYGSQQKPATPLRDTSLLRISRTPGPSGWQTPRRDPPKKFGAAVRRRKDRFRKWRKKPRSEERRVGKEARSGGRPRE